MTEPTPHTQRRHLSGLRAQIAASCQQHSTHARALQEMTSQLRARPGLYVEDYIVCENAGVTQTQATNVQQGA